MNSKNFIIYYNGIKITQEFEKNDLMIDILNNFKKKNVAKNKRKFIFINNGKEISFNFLEKGRIKAKMYKGKIILAFNIDTNTNINKWKLENILCPDCKNLAFITYNDEIISLECKICNKKNNYSISEFIDMQLENSILRCDKCKKLKNIYDGSNELYIYLDCDKELEKKEEEKEKKEEKKEDKESDKELKLCSDCKFQHYNNNNNDNYNYNIKYEYCIKHKKPFENYCNKCNKNFCEEEEKSHIKHDYFPLKRKKQKENYIDELKKKITELNNNIEKYRKELDVLKEIFDAKIFNMKKNLENQLKLNDYIYNASENLNNYHKIKNLDGIAYNKIINNIKSFLDYKIKDKFKYLIERFFSKNIPYNQIELSYTPIPLKTFQLFNEEFVNQNKEKCFLIIEDKITELCKSYEYKKKVSNEFKINFIALKPITDMKNMFFDCDLLNSFVSYNFDTSKVSDMSNMFRRCKKLINVKGIKDTSNVTNMNNMFSECKSLTCINNISNWNLSKVKNISYMFYQCLNLENISEYLIWDTSKIINMSYLFYGCSSLVQIPDISNWNTSNVSDMNHIFKSCQAIKSLPDLSKWRPSKLTNMKNMFEGCVHLEELPDISKWDTSKVVDMSGLLNMCESLKQIPDISNWDTSKVISMKEMFYFCKSLKKFPNISSWCTSKVNDISSMFFKCSALENVPDRTLFKKNIKDNDYDNLYNINDIKRKRTMINKPTKKLDNEDMDDIALKKAFTGKEKQIIKPKK